MIIESTGTGEAIQEFILTLWNQEFLPECESHLILMKWSTVIVVEFIVGRTNHSLHRNERF